MPPCAGLTAGSDGKFYGTTQDGGAAGGGTVFRLNPDGTAFEVLHAFTCASDGCTSLAGLTAGSDGKFYGTTRGGGAAGGGTVFRVNPDGTAFEVLHAFICESDGCFPSAGLTAGSDGKFYGTTSCGGGRGGGTVFRLNPDGTAFEVLHTFTCGSDGCVPAAGLTAGSDGKFYGTTDGGGAAGGGTVFRLNPDGTAFEVLHAFTCESGDGCGPDAGLTAGSDGKFYGTTRFGGGGGGTVFRLAIRVFLHGSGGTANPPTPSSIPSSRSRRRQSTKTLLLSTSVVGTPGNRSARGMPLRRFRRENLLR